jgi:hypothetical protein
MREIYERMALTYNRLQPFFAQVNRFRRTTVWAFSLALIAALCAGCAASRVEKQAGMGSAAGEQSAEEAWGILALHTRLTANGTMIDFRYRVLDPDKALPLFSREVKPYVVDEATGAKFGVPDLPKVGAVRSTTRNPAAGQEHFILFTNPNRFMKAGSKVTVVIGEYKKAHLVVE